MQRCWIPSMKKVLSLLVAFVFLQVQSWAFIPTYGALNNSVSGTYAGVLLADIGQNGLGLFQIGMPTAGLGSGEFAFYAGGGAFLGTVVALADGTKATMSGIMKGSLKEDIVVVTLTTSGTQLEDVALMGGKFVAQIKSSSSGTSAIGIGARLVGTGTVTVTGPGDIFVTEPPGITNGDTTLTLDGFLQSSAVTGQVSLSSLTGTTAAGGGGG
jgi:hypothetical protein